MTLIWNDPAHFTEDALAGFVDAYADVVRLVPGGVVRAGGTRPGKVAVVVGGGSGHYPAFCGLVGPGFADGAVVGNVFTSPSADDVVGVCRAASGGAGVVMLTGNYAGDVMNFTLGARRLAAEGIDARYVLVTDDVASAPVGQEAARRGIAGDLTVFKVAAAAAEAGYDLDAVEAVAHRANDRTRTMGVAFDGCTLPGAHEPLFTVPEGRMGVGVGIHGEPGIGETAMPTAGELATLLVERVLVERPTDDGAPARRAAVVLNGLGRTKYEELFLLWGQVAPLLREAGVEVVRPDVGELVTSLDMAGCSLTVMWLDDELERLWTAPAAAPAYRKGVLTTDDDGPRREATTSTEPGTSPSRAGDHVPPARDDADRALARTVVAAVAAATDAVAAQAERLGRLDAVAGDGDHGRGMTRGLEAARDAAAAAVETGAGAGGALVAAGRAWAGRAGGTSGVLWGAMLEAAGGVLAGNVDVAADPRRAAVLAVEAALDAAQDLGRARPGDKTLLDALVPFRDALAGADGAAAQAWREAVAVARRAAEATADLRPRVGRARPLAEQSVGTPDPGAVSLALVLDAAGRAAGAGPAGDGSTDEEGR